MRLILPRSVSAPRPAEGPGGPPHPDRPPCIRRPGVQPGAGGGRGGWKTFSTELHRTPIHCTCALSFSFFQSPCPLFPVDHHSTGDHAIHARERIRRTNPENWENLTQDCLLSGRLRASLLPAQPSPRRWWLICSWRKEKRRWGGGRWGSWGEVGGGGGRQGRGERPGRGRGGKKRAGET